MDTGVDIHSNKVNTMSSAGLSREAGAEQLTREENAAAFCGGRATCISQSAQILTHALEGVHQDQAVPFAKLASIPKGAPSRPQAPAKAEQDNDKRRRRNTKQAVTQKGKRGADRERNGSQHRMAARRHRQEWAIWVDTNRSQGMGCRLRTGDRYPSKQDRWTLRCPRSWQITSKDLSAASKFEDARKSGGGLCHNDHRKRCQGKDADVASPLSARANQASQHQPLAGKGEGSESATSGNMKTFGAWLGEKCRDGKGRKALQCYGEEQWPEGGLSHDALLSCHQVLAKEDFCAA
uniref:Uncharacterized protein n=1 Tax=Sphaerodactylus townsendi TaxID=933632 RepID=A0ACB8FKX4_9SAUR